MPIRRLNLFGAAVIMTAAGAAALLPLTIGSIHTPKHALPNPNGYDDFVQAGNLIVGDVSSFWNLDKDALCGLVSSNAEPLRLLRLGLTRKCSFPTDVALTNQGWMIGELPHLKYCALLFRAEGQLAEMDGRPGDAADSYLLAIRFGNEISRGGFLINRLVGVACEAIGQVALAKLVPSLVPPKAVGVAKELETIDHERVSFDEIKHNERRFGTHELFKQRNPINWITGAWEAWKMMQRYETRNKILVAHERLLATELALRCYRSERGRVVARLDDLIPNFLSNVPLDPFTEQPMIYRPGATNWLLYSFGQDGIDDGGVPAGKLSTKGDILFDSP
jgi:hypothetical protein